METLDLHGLILSVSEGYFSELLCIHNVDIETFCLHGLILCVTEGFLSELLYIHIVGIKYPSPLLSILYFIVSNQTLYYLILPAVSTKTKGAAWCWCSSPPWSRCCW